MMKTKTKIVIEDWMSGNDRKTPISSIEENLISNLQKEY